MSKTLYVNIGRVGDMSKSSVLLVVLFFGLFSERSFACDLCAIHNSIESMKPQAGSFHLGVSEQFTRYGTLQQSGRFAPNTQKQFMESSITQIVGAYDLSDTFSVQVSAPYVSRKFRRMVSEEIENGTEAGIGDISLVGRFIAYDHEVADTRVLLQFLGGVKLPTGESDRLGEESELGHHEEGISEVDEHDTHEVEHEEEASAEHAHKHAGHVHEEVPSAIHGHDLSLGSGSVDFPVGFSVLVQKGRVGLSGDLQYMIRTEGDFDYHYGDDLLWSVGPSYYVFLDHDSSVAVKANLSGEYKRKDEVGGEKENDTGITSTFLGPEIIVSAEPFGGKLAVDLPLEINNTGFQAVSDYRFRVAFFYRF